MSKVCVVTGGGSGMGLAAAKLMPKDHIIVVSGRTESKLTKAVEELTAAGFTAYAKSCDTSKRDSVQALADTDEAAFVDALLKICAVVEDAYKKNGLAYSLSKNFVTWYAAKCAFDFGPNGIRVASLSPGLIATDMGNLEADNGGPMLAFSCENRMGTPEELGFAIATLADERNGYLAGVDILCDGGTIRGMHEFKKPQQS